MSLEVASQDTKEFFKKHIDSTYLSGRTWEILHNSKMKPSTDGMFSKVKIPSQDMVMSGAPDFIIIINENYFDRLVEDYQNLFVIKTLANIGYDMEKETCIKVKPDYVEHGSIISKFGYEKLESFKLSVEQITDSFTEDKEK